MASPLVHFESKQQLAQKEQQSPTKPTPETVLASWKRWDLSHCHQPPVDKQSLAIVRGRLDVCNSSCGAVRVDGGTTVVSGSALRVAAVLLLADEQELRRGRGPLAGPLAGRLRDCLFVGGIL
ncbi:Hypothetical predicted protein [Paramuricea clavata]|uniref:Uncharacterized protein n=1 Tax=Paramuricea clavata TaxID=317549 RepID=A0A6S7IDR3_PARCT|nr:Hypothetical predicted protein [Paramuricea clavata]